MVTRYSVIIPVYRNAEFIPLLIKEFTDIWAQARNAFETEVEFVFVVDGSPDNCHDLLEKSLPTAPFPSQLVLHARNFGSFAAIRTGLHTGQGDFFGVIAADLQEPPDLLIDFLKKLRSASCDIVVGIRESREDPRASKFASRLFWRLYKRLILKEIPKEGVDVFACTRQVRDELLALRESHSSLVGLIFWLGFRRSEVRYARRARLYGKSGWSLRKKLAYLLDSVFSFTDLPIRALSLIGGFGLGIAVILSVVVTILRLAGLVEVPGYAATILILSTFSALNILGLGLVGSYAWRAYENTKQRPLAVIQQAQHFGHNET